MKGALEGIKDIRDAFNVFFRGMLPISLFFYSGCQDMHRLNGSVYPPDLLMSNVIPTNPIGEK